MVDVPVTPGDNPESSSPLVAKVEEKIAEDANEDVAAMVTVTVSAIVSVMVLAVIEGADEN